MKRALLVLGMAALCGCTYHEPVAYRVFGVEKLRQVKQNAKGYTGELLAFGGLVTDTEEGQDQTAFRMLVQDETADLGSNASAEALLFVVYRSTRTTIAKGHYVKVLGRIHEATVGKSLLGDRVSSLTLDAIAVYDTFTGYAFRLSPDERLFRKWQTGQPFRSD